MYPGQQLPYGTGPVSLDIRHGEISQDNLMEKNIKPFFCTQLNIAFKPAIMRRLARQGFRLAKMEEVEEGPERYTKVKVLALPEQEFVSITLAAEEELGQVDTDVDLFVENNFRRLSMQVGIGLHW